MTTISPIVGQLLRVDTIDLPEEYERKASLVEDDVLRQSIEKSGVQQSVIVMPSDRLNRFTLVKGGRRLRISEHLGLHTIPAVIVARPAGGEAAVLGHRNRLRFILTQARQDLLPSQRASLIKQLMSMFGMKQKEVASYLGVDAGSITNWLAIEKYHPEIVRMIDTNEINLHAARSFDGMTPEAQPKVFKTLKNEFRSLSGGKLHRIVRSKFSPKSHPDFYIAPEKTIEKLKRKQVGRRSRRRPKLSRDEKELMSKDLSLLETEYENGAAELKQLEREIKLAAQPINAIMRSSKLVAMLSDAVKEEFGRFTEIY
jgi:ParB/RepB/Spo0J family partition protein